MGSATLALASAGFAPSCEMQRRGRRPPGEVNFCRLNRRADRDPDLPSLPQAADAAACEAGLSQWWGDMAMCLYPAFIGAGDACEQLGLCKVKSVLGDWTCDDCTDIMTRVANFMQEPSTIEQGVAVLTGDCFCGAEGHTAECPDLVNSLTEPCMQVLSAVLMETTPELCQDIVGVC